MLSVNKDMKNLSKYIIDDFHFGTNDMAQNQQVIFSFLFNETFVFSTPVSEKNIKIRNSIVKVLDINTCTNFQKTLPQVVLATC